MTPVETFYAYHTGVGCDRPTPASDTPSVWGSIECKTCGFDIAVVSWLGGLREKDE